jgi:hypothetical protein
VAVVVVVIVVLLKKDENFPAQQSFLIVPPEIRPLRKRATKKMKRMIRRAFGAKTATKTGSCDHNQISTYIHYM